MLLKRPSKKQIDELITLHKTCFNDGDFYIDFFMKNKLKKADCFVKIEMDGTISGALYARPTRFKSFNQIIKIPFITGVATHPQFRNRGIASFLLNEACDYYTRKNLPYVMLYPFNHDFYRKQKFQTVNYFYRPFDKFSNEENPLNFDNLVEKFNCIFPKNFTAEKLSITDFYACKKIYDRSLKTEPFFQIRTKSYFKMLLTEHLLDGGSGILIRYFGQPYSYLLFYDEGIREMLFPLKLSDDIFSLFSEIIPSLECPINFRSRSKDDIFNPVISSDLEYCMARICNINKAFKIASYDKSCEKKLCFNLDDTFIKIFVRNKKAFSVKLFKPKDLPRELSDVKDKNFIYIPTTKEELVAGLLGNVNFNPLYKNIFYVYNILMYEKY